MGDYLWQIDRELVLRCVDALAAGAMLVQQAADSETSRPYHQRRPIDDVEAEVASAIQRRFFEPDGIPVDAHRAFDPTGWFGAEADKLILRILGYAPTEAVTIAAFERFASILVEWWDEDGSRLEGRQKGHPQRNCKAQSVMTELLEDFLLRTTAVNAAEVIAPIADAVDNHPDKVRWLLIGLISVEERQQNTAQFWLLWKMLAEKVRNAIWLAWIDNEYPGGAEMILAIFLVTWWKDGVRHWRSLEGHAEHIHALFEDLPACSEVLDAYVRFLYHIGEQSLPTAFVRVAMRLKQGEPMKMLTKRNTVFLLEALLQRYVYGRPLELKSKRDLREAVLFLLDLLVENGSSAAFRMRDDFVTSASLT
ncbi:MAG TPA: hypothetical protein DDZ84_01835 [Firmicutes bacterium]|nr:hypothetical protein [Bacillota bacterium]